MIEEKAKQGMYLKDIAEELGVHPRTVKRALARRGAPSGKRPKARISKLDAYKELIDQLLSEGVWNAQVILREIQARGYLGQGSILRAYVQPKRPLRSCRATVRFETQPGEQLQHDWTEVRTVLGGIEQKIYVAVNTLGYSRRFHFWAAPSLDAEHTYESLIRSFEYFGGVPAEVLVDNQKAAVLEHRGKGQVLFNPGFQALGRAYGFQPRACRPYRARTKGKDERMVGYVKHHFFVRYRQFESWTHLNQLAEQWLAEEADPRCHGTVHEVVAERFAREQPHLKALPAFRFCTDYVERRTVAWDGYIDVRGNRYSVPDELRGREVTLSISLAGQIAIYSGPGEKVAEHPLRPVEQGWSTVTEHHAKLWRQTLSVEQRDLSVYEEAAQCN
jgi:transposase